jgi:hypothetical protein
MLCFDRNQWNSRQKPDFWVRRGFGPFLGMAGQYKHPVQYRESPPIKAGQQELSPHLETTGKIHHINEEENVLISGTREKSAVGDSAEPTQ